MLLLYISAGVDALLGGYLASVAGIIIVAARIAAGFGIANEQKWGYQLGVAVAVVPFVLLFAGALPFAPIALMFDVLLLALLLHGQSRQHQAIWFS